MSNLQTLWIDEQGGLTAKRKDGRSMPLYDATEVEKVMKAERRRMIRIVKQQMSILVRGCKTDRWIRQKALLKAMKEQL